MTWRTTLPTTNNPTTTNSSTRGDMERSMAIGGTQAGIVWLVAALAGLEVSSALWGATTVLFANIFLSWLWPLRNED